MKRSTMWRIAGLAVGLGWVSVAMARGGARGGDGTPLSDYRLVGRVVSVDPQQWSFQVATAGTQATTKLTVAPNAHIVRDGLNVPFDELQPGDDVRASFLSDDLTRTHPWEIEARSPGGRVAPWGVRHGS
jgi:hypothetical protein